MTGPIPPPSQAPITPAEGVTSSERHLAKLCKRSFLSMWSYPAVFRDQGKRGLKGDGKEVCDLLVVFENDILIFSDKECQLQAGDNIQKNWARWLRKAVIRSAKQACGAERWIKDFPNHLFLDRQCKIPFPLSLPRPSNAIFHRIVVAHGASKACKEHFGGGSGSLMLDSRQTGDAHFREPFRIGQIDPSRGYVHVFDDTTLAILLETLDTISDFTAYLTKKEQLLTGPVGIIAPGEEELLAIYLSQLNDADEHDFVIDRDQDEVLFDEGFWDEFAASPQRRAQIKANEVSYFWDHLIEKFSFHTMTGTQYLTSGEPIKEQEVMFRFLAREPRTRRRVLSRRFLEGLWKSAKTGSNAFARVALPSSPGDPYYVFLFVKRRPDLPEEANRNARGNLLMQYCQAVKLRFPEAIHIPGIGTEADPPSLVRSEDLIYLNAVNWTAEQEAEARKFQQKLKLLEEVTAHRERELEYPPPADPKVRKRPLSRNSPCPCNSGKRYKRCCGKHLFQ